jgi:hypothetical protein
VFFAAFYANHHSLLNLKLATAKVCSPFNQLPNPVT